MPRHARAPVALLTIALSIGAFFAATTIRATEPAKPQLEPISKNVLRISGLVASYCLTTGRECILIGAPPSFVPADLPTELGPCKLVLLTHHHRDSSAGAKAWLAAGTPVRASKSAVAWLTPAGVEQFWNASLPTVAPGEVPPLFRRQWSIWAYNVLPAGIEGIQCDLEDGQKLEMSGWTIRVVATPGHSPDHIAYVVEPAPPDGRRIAFCGDALSAAGKIWTPYTTDWHHVNPTGLEAAAESIRRLAATMPTMLCPEHGPPIADNVQQALTATYENLHRAAQLKSFEVFRRESRAGAPLPAFIAPEQVGTATPDGNTKPWQRLSPHLFLSGNTYVLASTSGRRAASRPIRPRAAPAAGRARARFQARSGRSGPDHARPQRSLHGTVCA